MPNLFTIQFLEERVYIQELQFLIKTEQYLGCARESSLFARVPYDRAMLLRGQQQFFVSAQYNYQVQCDVNVASDMCLLQNTSTTLFHLTNIYTTTAPLAEYHSPSYTKVNVNIITSSDILWQQCSANVNQLLLITEHLLSYSINVVVAVYVIGQFFLIVILKPIWYFKYGLDYNSVREERDLLLQQT